MACFLVSSTYATSQVSVVLDICVFTAVMVLFCLGITLKEKKSLLGRIWSFTGKRGMRLSSIRCCKNTVH